MRLWSLLALAVTAVGCGRSVLVSADPDAGGDPHGDDCPSGVELGGTCVGVSVEGRCHGQPWLAGMSCDDVVFVEDEVGLTAALGKASSGACIDLAPGSYGDHTLPPGVSLLGRGWDCVSIGELRMASGVVRGVGAVAVVVEGGDVAISEVDVVGGEDGVSVEGGASASLRHVTVSGSARYAIAAFDSRELSVDAVHVLAPGGPGLWAQCGDAPAQCSTARPPVSLRRSYVEGAAIVGVSLVNVAAELVDVVISDSTVGSNFEAGGNLSVVNATLDARRLTIRDAADFGVLLHDSQVALGAPDDDPLQIAGNLRGLWVQGAGSDVTVSNVAFSDNLGVSLGIDAGATLSAKGVTIRRTRSISLPVLVNGVSAGSVEVGDGVVWGGGATAQLSRLSVGGSDRVPVLIDGSVGAGSALENIELTDGDAAVGIIHQNVFPGGILPAIGPGVPEPTTTAEELYPVPGL